MKRIVAFVIALSLIAAMATVCVCAEDGAPSNQLGETDVTVTAPEDSESETEEEKGGCRSSVGLGAIALVAVIGAAASLTKKEK